MNKTAIKNFAVWARQKLIDDIKYKAGMLGITENGIAEKLPQSTKDLQFFDIGTKNYAEVSGKEISQRNALIYAIKHKETEGNKFKEAFKYVVEEVAYTWFNRLIAIRFMEVNDYLPSGIRVLSSENKAKNEPDFVTSPFDTDLEFTPYEQDRVVQLKDENKLDELFRMLFIKQCNKLHDILPELFEKTDDYTELLLTISFTDKDGIVYRLTHDIDEDDFNIDKEGQVEIIGWMYQYYNIEPKAEVFGRKSGTKMSKEDIPAATQLFTPDWIVRYMVENSVGRIWIEGHPNDSLRSSWEYYIDETKQEQQVVAKLEEIKATYKELSPEKIKVIDPCMGSGHILVYAFDVLMQIYESYGYTQRDAARSILQNNIFGLDIDERAYGDALDKYFRLGKNLNQRDTIAVRKMVGGFIKLLYPDGEYSKEQLEEILQISLEMRRRVKEQLKKLGGMEFYDVNFSYIDNETFEEHYVSVPEQGGGKLIPEGMCNPGQVYTVAQGKSGMLGVFRLESQMMAGNGKFERSGLGSDSKCKEATNTAFNFLKANSNRISGSISTTTKDYIINYQDLQGIGMTEKLALPTLIALSSVALGKPTASSLAVLGEISIAGTLIKVDELANCLQVCLDSGAKKVLLPITSAADLSTVPAELIGCFNLIFYSSAEDAVYKALGVE